MMLIPAQLLLICHFLQPTISASNKTFAKMNRRYGQDVNNRFKLEANAIQVPTRLLELMRTYYEDAVLRVIEINHMRFMYEESPHYEQGYVMHEIIERYKKMAELVIRQHQKSTYVMGAVQRLKDIQKIHFEIYHLVNMMHEIPIKWRIVDEFNDNKKEVQENIKQREAKAAYEKAEKQEEKAKKKRMKLLKKMRMQRLESGNLVTDKPSAKRHPYNTRWPIDYGWEIDDMPWNK